MTNQTTEQSSREAFENWCVETDLFLRADLKRSSVDYQYADIDSAWSAWQARDSEVAALKAEIERLKASADALADAGISVVARWDSPSWKDLPHTADYIHRLRHALSAYAAVKGGA